MHRESRADRQTCTHRRTRKRADVHRHACTHAQTHSHWHYPRYQSTSVNSFQTTLTPNPEKCYSDYPVTKEK